MWVFNFGQNRRIFHARVLLDGGAIQDIDRHYPQNPRTARLKPCSGRLIRRVSRLCTKKRRRYRGSIGQHRLLRCRSCSLCSALPRLGVAPRRWAVAAAARGFDRAPGDHRFCRRPRRNSASVVIESVRIKYWHAEAKGASGPSRSSALKCSVCRARSAGSRKYICGYPRTSSRRCSSPKS